MRARLKKTSADGWRIPRPRRNGHSRSDDNGQSEFDLGPTDELVDEDEAADVTARDLRAERRMRASGGPEDRAAYQCQCGYIFEARVSTSVACPNCGSSQAW
jgi:rubrerythrin